MYLASFTGLKLLIENPEEMDSSLQFESPEEITKGKGGEYRDEDVEEMWEEDDLEDCRRHNMKIANPTGTSRGTSCRMASFCIFLCIA